jgi:hypothetical protein
MFRGRMAAAGVIASCESSLVLCDCITCLHVVPIRISAGIRQTSSG